MKTTLAILGIFAAAVLATSFTVSAYAISQNNGGSIDQDQKNKQTNFNGVGQSGVFNTQKNNNYQNQDAKQIFKNTAGLCHFC